MKNKLVTFLLISNLIIVGCATLGKSEQSYLQSAKNNLAVNNSQAALESANKAININPQNYYAYYLSAQAYQNLNNPSEALKNYQQAMKLKKSESQLLVSYANFLCAQQDYGKAEALYNSAYKLSKESATSATSLYINYGDCLLSQNKLDLAIDSYGKALADESVPITAYIGITYAYLLEKNYASANYYANLYKQASNKDLLNLRIMALTGLLKTNSNLPNRQELQNQLAELTRQIVILNENPSLAPNKATGIAPVINTQAIFIPESVPIVATTAATTETYRPTVIHNTNYALPNGWIRQDANGRKYIIVSHGDTLYNISKRANRTQQQLINLNKLKSKNVDLGSKIYLD